MIEKNIKVSGMSCTGCENRIQNSLKTIPGVIEVNADHVTENVSITSAMDISEDVIISKIEDIGFKVVKD